MKSQGHTVRTSSALAVSAGLLAVFLWSTAASVAGSLSRYMSYAGIAFYPLLFASLALVPLQMKSGLFTKLRRVSWSGRASVLIASCALAFYELAMFYSLTHAPRIEAYILTYLWPIFFIILRLVVERQPIKTVPYTDWLYALIAFLGALLLPLGSGPIRWQNSVHTYWTALSGAILIAIYITAQRRVQADIGGRRPALFLTTALSLPVILIFVHFAKADLAWRLTPASVALTGYEGICVFMLGYLALFYSIERHPNVTLTSMMYLVPLVSVIWLHIFLKEPIYPLTLFAAVLIVLANFALHSEHHSTSATTASMAFALLAGLICYLTPSHGRGGFAQLIDITAGAFAVLVAFTLNRVATKSQTEKQMLATVGSRAGVLTTKLRGKHGGMPVPIRDELDRIFRRLVDYHFDAHEGKNAEQLINAVYQSELQVTRLLENTTNVSEVLRLELFGAAQSLFEAVDQWLLLRSERLRSGEFVAVLLLGLLTILMFIVARPDSLSGDLAAIAFTTGIVFVLFAIRDYDENRLDHNATKVMILEHVFTMVGVDYYVPRALLERVELGRMRYMERIRFEDSHGQLQYAIIDRTKTIFSGAIKLAFVLAFIWILVLLTLKR